MRRPPSALTAIGGFGVLVTAISVATTASIVLLVPDPPALRMTVAAAAAALRGAPSSLERRDGPVQPGVRAPVLEQALAQALGRPLTEVRVVWLDTTKEHRPSSFIVVKPRADVANSPLVLRRREAGPNGSATAVMADNMLIRVLMTLPQPAFTAGVRREDGQWVSVAPAQGSWGGWRLKVLAALGTSLLLLAPLAWLFARRLTRPFRSLARAIDTGVEPPDVGGPRELRDASNAIVALRARLAGELEERLRMLVAVAHDLRTPLTSLRLRIEAVAEPQRTRMALDTDRMQAMIGDVLAFALATDAPRHTVAVRPIVEAAIADVPCASATVRLADGPDISVVVTEETFRRAIENLVRNAVDYAHGGIVHVQREGGDAVLTISDDGPGIAKAERARLMRPFERGEASRNRETGGVGLGLSIVASFVAAHGGSLTIGEAAGGGALVTLRLPTDTKRDPSPLG